jgi:hypothetical protein
VRHIHRAAFFSSRLFALERKNHHAGAIKRGPVVNHKSVGAALVYVGTGCRLLVDLDDNANGNSAVPSLSTYTSPNTRFRRRVHKHHTGTCTKICRGSERGKISASRSPRDRKSIAVSNVRSLQLSPALRGCKRLFQPRERHGWSSAGQPRLRPLQSSK